MGAAVARHVRAFAGLPWRARWRWLSRRIASAVTGRIASADRRLLERDILPAYAARAHAQTLLFVGCDRATAHYARIFDRSATAFCTLDIDPARRRFGAARHAVARLEDAASHFAPGSLDVIICNGVLGFGLDDRAAFESAMRSCFACLRDRGELLLGWNNVPAYAPFDPSEVVLALGYARAARSPLRAWRVETDTPTRHTYDAYVKEPR